MVNQNVLCSTTWVHCYEEDSSGNEVYRPITADIPLSRRPREQLDFQRGGTATLRVPSADDRLISHAVRWQSGATGDADLQILEVSAQRLVIASRATGQFQPG
ncbi:MAG: hypothetical protein IPG25_17765 [Proteobacteria bacterium]|nr:hypothetical protein [Pseudomonadota bacterium]